MIKIINKDEEKKLENLLQLYLHDISLYFDMSFDSTKCVYDYDDISKYFDNSGNYAYFIIDDENIAGFILVDKLNDNAFSIQEMFVLNNYKSKGIGNKAVCELLEKHKGNWTIKSLPSSPKAENFWIKTIKNYTKGNFNVEYVGKFNRAVLTFNNEK